MKIIKYYLHNDLNFLHQQDDSGENALYHKASLIEFNNWEPYIERMKMTCPDCLLIYTGTVRYRTTPSLMHEILVIAKSNTNSVKYYIIMYNTISVSGYVDVFSNYKDN